MCLVQTQILYSGIVFKTLIIWLQGQTLIPSSGVAVKTLDMSSGVALKILAMCLVQTQILYSGIAFKTLIIWLQGRALIPSLGVALKLWLCTYKQYKTQIPSSGTALKTSQLYDYMYNAKLLQPSQPQNYIQSHTLSNKKMKRFHRLE